jgi:hypothetical protein
MAAVIIPERVVYIAHVLSAADEDERQANRTFAEEWISWLTWNFPIAPIANWVTWCRFWPESMRTRGIAINKRHIELCDEAWLVGPRVSEGMLIEASHARSLGKPVHNITAIRMPSAYRAPETWGPELEAISRIVGLGPVARPYA